jgi:dihydrodipicolinate synthase/N-acetylneuraminate lyase
MQRRLVPVNTAVTARFGIPGLKAALEMRGYYGGPVRLPLRPLDDGALQTLEAILVQGKVL